MSSFLTYTHLLIPIPHLLTRHYLSHVPQVEKVDGDAESGVDHRRNLAPFSGGREFTVAGGNIG